MSEDVQVKQTTRAPNVPRPAQHAIKPKMFRLNKIIDSFIDSRIGCAPGTVHYYRAELDLFWRWLQPQKITMMEQLERATIEKYMDKLRETRGVGGVHASWRAIRAMVNWYENEYEPEYWTSPIHKLRVPAYKVKPIEGITEEVYFALLRAAQTIRDKAIYKIMMDTGARASEIIWMDIENVDWRKRRIKLLVTKGGEPRTVFFGQSTKDILRAYLRTRKDTSSALFVSQRKTRITYAGIYHMIRRHSELAAVEHPTPHDFRRKCISIVYGTTKDLLGTMKISGHHDPNSLKRYVTITLDQVQDTFDKASPVDKMRM